MTKTSQIYFNSRQLKMVGDAAQTSEELVNNYYKLSSGQWLKNRYDIKTVRDLEAHEQVNGPVAQVIKYEVRKKDIPLGSSSINLYRICLMDQTILSTVDRGPGICLEPFLLYVITHELVHVVRFSKYQQRYENKNEADMTFEEERKVHRLTHEILARITVPGLMEVFDFYRDWRLDKER